MRAPTSLRVCCSRRSDRGGHCKLTCRWSGRSGNGFYVTVYVDANIGELRSMPVRVFHTPSPPFSRVGTLCWHAGSTCAYARFSWRRTPLDGARHREQRLEHATARQQSSFVLYIDESASSWTRTVADGFNWPHLRLCTAPCVLAGCFKRAWPSYTVLL